MIPMEETRPVYHPAENTRDMLSGWVLRDVTARKMIRARSGFVCWSTARLLVDDACGSIEQAAPTERDAVKSVYEEFLDWCIRRDKNIHKLAAEVSGTPWKGEIAVPVDDRTLRKAAHALYPVQAPGHVLRSDPVWTEIVKRVHPMPDAATRTLKKERAKRIIDKLSTLLPLDVDGRAVKGRAPLPYDEYRADVLRNGIWEWTYGRGLDSSEAVEEMKKVVDVYVDYIKERTELHGQPTLSAAIRLVAQYPVGHDARCNVMWQAIKALSGCDEYRPELLRKELDIQCWAPELKARNERIERLPDKYDFHSRMVDRITAVAGTDRKSARALFTRILINPKDPLLNATEKEFFTKAYLDLLKEVDDKSVAQMLPSIDALDKESAEWIARFYAAPLLQDELDHEMTIEAARLSPIKMDAASVPEHLFSIRRRILDPMSDKPMTPPPATERVLSEDMLRQIVDEMTKENVRRRLFGDMPGKPIAPALSFAAPLSSERLLEEKNRERDELLRLLQSLPPPPPASRPSFAGELMREIGSAAARGVKQELSVQARHALVSGARKLVPTIPDGAMYDALLALVVPIVLLAVGRYAQEHVGPDEFAGRLLAGATEAATLALEGTSKDTVRQVIQGAAPVLLQLAAVTRPELAATTAMNSGDYDDDE